MLEEIISKLLWWILLECTVFTSWSLLDFCTNVFPQCWHCFAISFLGVTFYSGQSLNTAIKYLCFLFTGAIAQWNKTTFELLRPVNKQIRIFMTKIWVCWQLNGSFRENKEKCNSYLCKVRQLYWRKLLF